MGDDDLAALAAQPFGEPQDLGGLARTLTALEGHEPARRRRAASRGTWCESVTSRTYPSRRTARTSRQGAFFAVAFFAAAFLAVVFFAVDFLAVRFAVVRRVVFLAGPRARFSASSSTARSRVTDSTASPLRNVAFVSPSVTYGPNRPSLTTIGLPETGSLPSSRSGAGRGSAAQLGLGVDRQRLVERDREQLVLGLQRPGVGALASDRARSGRSAP